MTTDIKKKRGREGKSSRPRFCLDHFENVSYASALQSP